MTDDVKEVDPWASKPEPWMILASGTQAHPFDPTMDEINIEDIAQSLSKQCRFNGHIKPIFVDDIYSVAQHCVLAEMLVVQQGSPEIVITPQMCLGILLHDSGEQLFGDLVSPVKSRYPEFKKDEVSYTTLVYEKFGVPSVLDNPALHKIIHWADWQMVLMEVAELTSITDKLWHEWVGFEQPMGLLMDIDPDFRLWGPRESQDRFLTRFHELQEYV